MEFFDKFSIESFWYSEIFLIRLSLEDIEGFLIDFYDHDILRWFPIILVEKILNWCISIGDKMSELYKEFGSEYAHHTKNHNQDDGPYRENMFEIFELLHKLEERKK